MSKVDKEFKEEFDREFNNGSYATRRIAIPAVAVVIALLIVGSVGRVAYTNTVGKAQKNAEREVFKESVAYNEQAASFLAKSYKEYNDAESDTDKSTIMEYVIMRYPNLDTDSIDNEKLKQFYIKCMDN